MVSFALGEKYTSTDIRQIIGGSAQPLFVRRDKRVVGCRYNPKQNRLAPSVLLIGRNPGPRKFAAAEIFAAQEIDVPFFKKLAANEYEYIGDFRVDRWSGDSQVIERMKKKGQDNNVDLVLWLERADSLQPDSLCASLARQSDPLKRKEIEDAAVKEVTRHYGALGYGIKDRQADNVGWDLEALRNQECLLLEVKGLSGTLLIVELTPNEYCQMQACKVDYRLCVVTDALKVPILTIFRYSTERVRWEDDLGNALVVDEVVAARLHA